ncbi:hypothetical protein VFPBJ_07033 [Purpureocillium lilacinum]|uniref:Uncharacterized protein n=1 Tax=Purpureocillium lilacinum TaxID=33203 RepID=A0A179GMB0_PURLI|nr:hypothetical protein VFPBJ_07033 [Purpureocillium lilacinum]
MCSLEVRVNVPVEMWLNSARVSSIVGPDSSVNVTARRVGHRADSRPTGSALAASPGATDGTGPPLFRATAAWRKRGCRRRQGRSLLTATGPVGVGVAAYRIPHSSCDDAPIAPPQSASAGTPTDPRPTPAHPHVGGLCPFHSLQQQQPVPRLIEPPKEVGGVMSWVPPRLRVQPYISPSARVCPASREFVESSERRGATNEPTAPRRRSTAARACVRATTSRVPCCCARRCPACLPVLQRVSPPGLQGCCLLATPMTFGLARRNHHSVPAAGQRSAP